MYCYIPFPLFDLAKQMTGLYCCINNIYMAQCYGDVSCIKKCKKLPLDRYLLTMVGSLCSRLLDSVEFVKSCKPTKVKKCDEMLAKIIDESFNIMLTITYLTDDNNINSVGILKTTLKVFLHQMTVLGKQLFQGIELAKSVMGIP